MYQLQLNWLEPNFVKVHHLLDGVRRCYEWKIIKSHHKVKPKISNLQIHSQPHNELNSLPQMQNPLVKEEKKKSLFFFLIKEKFLLLII